ncbi:hypothetical protein QBA75_39130 [Streptomyces stelliscabiei]
MPGTPLRSRISAFTGTFIALVLGTALLSTMGLVLAASVASPEHGPAGSPRHR